MPNSSISTERPDPKTRTAPDAALESAGEGPDTDLVMPGCPDPKNCTPPGTPLDGGLDQSAV